MPGIHRILQAARFGCHLEGFLRKRMDFAQAKDILRERLARREDNFLVQMERCVFGRADSPYRPLLSAAGCAMGDLRDMVRRDGLEKTLLTLKDAGVYVTFEEFKGRRPIQRAGLEYRVLPEAFDNPFVRHYYATSTGGSTGSGITVRLDLDHIADMVPYATVFHHFIGTAQAPHALYFPIFPGYVGPTVMLKQHMAGMPIASWFTPPHGAGTPISWQQRLVRFLFLGMLRRHGFKVPDPEPVSLDRADILAQRLHELVRDQGRCFFGGYLSTCVRICRAAQEKGLDLSGVIFSGGGEPPTPAKMAIIERTGAVNIPNYFMTETDAIGSGCLCPSEINDNHLFEDALALIQAPREVFGHTVGAFYFTTLLSAAPKIMLNVESDDYGIVEKRDCGCPYGELGFATHVRSIRSYGKLTGNGVTLVGSDALHILEHRLPELFGGGPFDYQLREEEQDGDTRLVLVVSPDVPPVQDKRIVEAFFAALTEDPVANPGARDQWRAFDSLTVVRERPATTSRGKVLPLHIATKP